ncbi:MAG: substrate-binding periplasmic protein [Desulforhopalus sp.]
MLIKKNSVIHVKEQLEAVCRIKKQPSKNWSFWNLFMPRRTDLHTGTRRINRIMPILIGLSLICMSLRFPDGANAEGLPVAESQTIVFTTIFPPSMPFFRTLFDIYTEAFGRMGYKFMLISQPGERAMIDANQGVVDGEAGRIMDIESKKYPNLIRVPQAIVTMQDGAYAIDDSITVEGWESLTGKPYTVGLLKGIKSIEQKLPLYVDKNHIVTLGSIDQAVEMLRARRIDIFIVGTQIEDLAVMKSGDSGMIKRLGIVETKTLYPWMHKRHKHLVQPLAETLRVMKSEGVFDF